VSGAIDARALEAWDASSVEGEADGRSRPDSRMTPMEPTTDTAARLFEKILAEARTDPNIVGFFLGGRLWGGGG